MSTVPGGASFGPGRVFFVHEVTGRLDLAGHSTRLVGMVTECDAFAGRMMLTFRQACIEVDTHLLDHRVLSLGSLTHVVGELEADPRGALRLRARVACNADGLDTTLFEQALTLQREHEAR